MQPAEDSAFEGMDVVLGAAENDIAKRFAPAIVKAGAVFVDNSSAFRMDPNVPLVIPEINPEDVRRHKGHHRQPQLHHHRLVGGHQRPESGQPPSRASLPPPIRRCPVPGPVAPVSLWRRWSFCGRASPSTRRCSQYQIAYNVIPQIGGEVYEGYTSEEMKMQNEGPQDHASAGPAGQLHLRPGAGGAEPQRLAGGSYP